jgi:hypothetical protein
MAERALTELRKMMGGKTETLNVVSAGASGLFDGFVVKKLGTAGTILWLLKTIGVPVASGFKVPVPKGLYYHCVGQLGFVVALLLS